MKSSAEFVVVAALIAAIACVGRTEKPRGFHGEIVARKTVVDPRTGEPVVALTVGFRRSPELYEQDTRFYNHLAPEARFQVGDCVLVQPYGQEVRLNRC